MNEEYERFLDLMESDQSDPEVQYEIGRCYLSGQGVEQNGVEAEKWLRRAAGQGHQEAAALLAQPEETPSTEECPLEEDTLADWCLRAENGDVEAQFQVAAYFLDRGEEAEQKDAERYLDMAAKQGHPEACLRLAQTWLERGQAENAIPYLRNAADCRLGQAAELLGECYSKGIGTPQDEEEAQRRFIQAAEWGGGEQMYRLAVRYAQGDCVPVSMGRAYRWLKKAQENGCPDAKDRFDRYIQQKKQESEEEEARQREIEAQRQAQKEEERRRLNQEEAERQAREEEERQRKAQEEAERQAREEEERQRKAQEEAERKAREEAVRQKKAKEEAKRRAEIQAKNNAKAEKVTFWIGMVMLCYSVVGVVYQLLERLHVPLPMPIWELLELFVTSNGLIQMLLFGSLPAICCAGWYIVAKQERKPKFLHAFAIGLLVVQVLLAVSGFLKGPSLAGIVALVIAGAICLVWNVLAWYGLIKVVVVAMRLFLGAEMSWTFFEEMEEEVRASKQKQKKG